MNTNWNDPNFQGFGRQPRPKRERHAVGTPVGRTLLNIAVTLVFAAVYFYVVLPPISLKSEDFYIFVLLVCAVYGGCAILTSGFQGTGVKGYFGFLKKQCTVPLVIAAALVVTALVGAVIGWQLFRAGDYRDLLTVTDGDFAAEVEEISYDQIPMLDANSATKLGNRKLGELADMVSQFEVADDYTQINYQGRPVRVTPLRYGDIVKWLNNRADGLPAYLLIDMVTQNVEVVRLEDGIHYTTAEHFSRNLYRHLRFHYPTYMFDEPAFEIDENGDPWWVCPRVSHTIGLFGGRDIIGAVLVNAVTGESAYYKTGDVPNWVDHVYTAQPTYFMALKDAAELVKMYAMVNVSQYQIVATGDTVASCEANYRRILAEKGLVSADDADLPLTGQNEASSMLDDIRSAVVDGNTLYYLHLTGDSHYYVISAAVQPEVVIYNTGDYVTIRFADGEGTILTADSAERTAAPVHPAQPQEPAEPDAAA